MKEELQKQLVTKYPYIFCDVGKSPRKSCMAFGISVDDGWYDIIDCLCSKLTLIRKKTGIQVIADQVKEKFGGLRFYVHFKTSLWTKIRMTVKDWLGMRSKAEWGSIIYDVISRAESDSYHCCERCGRPGELCDKKFGEGKLFSAWMLTLCNKCREKAGYLTDDEAEVIRAELKKGEETLKEIIAKDACNPQTP